MSINGLMFEQIVQPYNEILFNNKNEWSTLIGKNMNEPQEY